MNATQILKDASNYSINENDEGFPFSVAVKSGAWIQLTRFFKTAAGAELHIKQSYPNNSHHVYNRETGSVVYKNY